MVPTSAYRRPPHDSKSTPETLANHQNNNLIPKLYAENILDTSLIPRENKTVREKVRLRVKSSKVKPPRKAKIMWEVNGQFYNSKVQAHYAGWKLGIKPIERMK